MAPRKTPRRGRISLTKDEQEKDAVQIPEEGTEPAEASAGDEKVEGVSPEEQEVWDAVREEQYEGQPLLLRNTAYR